MTKLFTFSTAIVAAALLGITALAQQQRGGPARAPRPGVDWPAFRGIDANGVVTEGRPTPTTFTPASAAWRTKIPGLGNSSPIVWGDLLCVTTAISEKDNSFKPGLYGNIEPVNDSSPHEWKVICLDKRTGATRWEQTVHKGVPAVKRHPKSTQANATLATDGTHLAAFFGSEGLHVYDLAGKRLWSKNFGVLDSGFFEAPEAQWGFAASPIIHNGVVIVLADVQKNSFLAAFDVATGKELWRVARSDVPTWGTPAIVDAGGRTQVVVNGWKHTGGYDFETGRELWKLTGGGDIPTPTPIAGHGLIFITSAHGNESPVHAIRPTATGDISLKRRRDQQRGRRVERAARRLVHGDAAPVRRLPVRRAMERHPGRVRGANRHSRLSAAPRPGRDGVHGVAGRQRRTHLFRDRGRRGLRGQGRTDLRAGRDEQARRGDAGDAGDLGRPAVHPHQGRDPRVWQLRATYRVNRRGHRGRRGLNRFDPLCPQRPLR